MTDHDEAAEPSVAPAIPEGDRSTAPQSDYDTSDVLRGLGVLLVGFVLTFGIALVL